MSQFTSTISQIVLICEGFKSFAWLRVGNSGRIFSPVNGRSDDLVHGLKGKRGLDVSIGILVDYKLVKGVPYDWTPNYSNADAITSGKLSRGRDVINFYAYTYFSQSQGKELIYYSNTISNEEWRGGDVETYHSKKFKVFKTRLTSSISKRVKLVYYWYQIGGKVASSDFDAKLFQLAGQLNGRQDVALLAVSTDCNVGCADAEKMLNKLIEPVNDMYLSLIKYE